MKQSLFLLVLILPFFLLAQQQEYTNSKTVDSKYLEDQIYFGLNYNFMNDKPSDVTQRNFSYGLQLGVIRDIPLNRKRNFGIGIGLGYANNSYYSNLISTESNGIIQYTTDSDDIDLIRSKFETHSVEFPFQFRWRTSTPTDYKFFRVYTGFKLAYNFGYRSVLVTDDYREGFSNTDIEKVNYGLTFNFGYNTFNLHLYYALNSFLKEDAVLDTGESIEFKPLRLGLIFYLL
ncbi:PorT family protein [Cellulophaga baltica]|uniref:porin family protein n=1 Tax=Cellulophaga TaxID=104264 RepID=UPI001C07253E|nr:MULTISPECIES: porin family protein [Cellulophaga]MBU2997228.1 PorT family protein [Cellulophaga baltica]MDO6768626.1 porin family protein [Cellulophaga sp. 1_MG-2023]